MGRVKAKVSTLSASAPSDRLRAALESWDRGMNLLTSKQMIIIVKDCYHR
jgi:hypothetical protein